jgi:hypothetical protein
MVEHCLSSEHWNGAWQASEQGCPQDFGFLHCCLHGSSHVSPAWQILWQLCEPHDSFLPHSVPQGIAPFQQGTFLIVFFVQKQIFSTRYGHFGQPSSLM